MVISCFQVEFIADFFILCKIFVYSMFDFNNSTVTMSFFFTIIIIIIITITFERAEFMTKLDGLCPLFHAQLPQKRRTIKKQN